MSDEVARAKIEPGLLVTATSTVLPDVSWAKLLGTEVLVRALVVAEGDLALLLPAVALSQRSAHRRVRDYVLIDPDLPPVSDGWPDAPVTVVTDDVEGLAARQGRLRGWRVITHPQWAADPA